MQNWNSEKESNIDSQLFISQTIIQISDISHLQQIKQQLIEILTSSEENNQGYLDTRPYGNEKGSQLVVFTFISNFELPAIMKIKLGIFKKNYQGVGDNNCPESFIIPVTPIISNDEN